jgi:hypothetical protein
MTLKRLVTVVAVLIGLVASACIVPVTSAAAFLPMPNQTGYWLATADGGAFGYGTNAPNNVPGGVNLTAPVVGIAPSGVDGGGYWVAAANGGVSNHGADYYGSASDVHLAAPIVGITNTYAGGYWLVAADGGVFTYGNAAFYGSAGGTHLNSPVVGMATPSIPSGRHPA